MTNKKELTDVRITQIEMVDATELSPAEYNPRTINEDSLNKLKKGLSEFGCVDPIIINKDGTVIGGHQRLKAAIELGWLKVPCVRLDVDKKREKALNLALNKISGEWDFPKLSEILLEFEADSSFDIELTGFDDFEAGNISENFGKLAGAFEGPSLLDIYNKESETKSNSRLNPSKSIIVSVGAFIEGLGDAELEHDEWEEAKALTDKFQLSADSAARKDIALKVLKAALKELTKWQKTV